MSIIKVEEVQLHTSDMFGNTAENIQAEAFFERTGVPFTRIYYNNLEDVKRHIQELNLDYSRGDENFAPITKVPFLKYTEVHDDIPARLSPVKFVEGVDAIKAFPAFYFSIGNP